MSAPCPLFLQHGTFIRSFGAVEKSQKPTLSAVSLAEKAKGEQACFAIPGRPVVCSNCEYEGVGRRNFLKFGAAGIVALGLGRPVVACARRRGCGDHALTRGGARRAEIRATSAM